MKKIKIGFSLYGLLIVVLQSLPNIVWVLWPPASKTAVWLKESSKYAMPKLIRVTKIPVADESSFR